MGILRWLRNKTYMPGMIGSNAVTQYHKARRSRLADSDQEIADFLWFWRYLNARAMNRENRRRLSHYVESKFAIETMMDFCLSNMDIEMLIDPTNDLFGWAAWHILQELNQGKVPALEDEINSFTVRWFAGIKPLRDGG